jgi:hypothetical protein
LWWDSDQDEFSRALRMKRHLLAHLQAVPPYERLSGLMELERVLAVAGAGMITDLDLILDFLMEEALFADRAGRLVSLARTLIHGDEGAVESARRRLLTVLLGHFEEAGAGSAAALLYDFNQESLLKLGSDEDPLARALVAAHFSGSKLPEEQALLLALLEDEEPQVEAAAVAALGYVQLEDVRTELLFRARFSEGMVRQAALEACGRLGGEGVQEVLINGLAERELSYQLSALRGLVLLADPEQISFFVSYLQLGEESPHYRIAFEALEAFGPAAYPALLRIANLKRHKAHRASALLLARAGVGEVVSSLISILEGGPDAEVAYELAVLTCFDLRSAEEPALEYASWLKAEDHQDPWRWFQEATVRREFECPPRSEFEGGGTREAALFLLEIVSRSDLILAERGRRELEVLLDLEFLEEPARSEDRQFWLEDLRDVIERVYPAAGGEE